MQKEIVRQMQRMDLPTFLSTTVGDDTGYIGYGEGLLAELTAQFGYDTVAAIARGFRVEIPDQSTAAGDYVVHSGLALDRFGRFVKDDADLDAQKEGNCALANTTYYIEVELTWAAGLRASRAYWNPLTDNGTQPSGDPVEPGHEYPRTLPSVLFTSWKLLPNTTGFTWASNRDSARIPVAVLKTNGSGEIDVTTWTTSVPRTILKRKTGLTTQVLDVMDAQLIPDSCDISVDVAGVSVATATVSSVDRLNNRLYLAAQINTVIKEGARVRVTTASTPAYLRERGRGDAPLPTYNNATSPLPGAGATADARVMARRGNTALGRLALQDPYAAAGLSDVGCTSDNLLLHAVVAQLRKLGFGGYLPADTSAPSTDGVGQSGPPALPTDDPEWYDDPGSVLGARTNWRSVGDGVNSHGDCNVKQLGGVQVALARAISEVPDGGIVYIKRGSYPAIKTKVTIASKKVKIIADPGVVLEFDGGDEVFALVNSTVHFEDLTITNTGAGTNYAVTVTGASSVISAKRCTFSGFYINAAASLQHHFERCSFSTTVAPGYAFRATGALFMTFERCYFASTFNDAAARAVLLTTCTATFTDCILSMSGAATTSIVEIATAGIADFDKVTFTVGGSSTATAITAGAATSVHCDRCLSGTTLLDGTNVTAVTIDRSDITIGADKAGVTLTGATAAKRYLFRRTRVTQTAWSANRLSVAFSFADTSGVTVDDCEAVNCDYGITIGGTLVKNTTIRDFRCESSQAGVGRVGVYATATTLTSFKIKGLSCDGFDDSVKVAETIAAVWLVPGGATSRDIRIEGVRINNHGASANEIAYGVRLVGTFRGVRIDGIDAEGMTALAGASARCEVVSCEGGVCTDIEIRRVVGKTLSGDTARLVYVSRYYKMRIVSCSAEALDATSVCQAICFGDGATGLTDGSRAFVSENTIGTLTCAGSLPEAIRARYGADRLIISRNEIEASANDLGIRIESKGGATADRASRCIISENIFSATSLADAFTYAILLELQDATDVQFVLVNNLVNEVAGGGSAIRSEGAIGLSGSIIACNAIRTSGDDTVHVDLANGASLSAFAANSLINNGTSGASGDGIKATSSLINCVIAVNTAQSNGPSATRYVVDMGAASVNTNAVVGNVLDAVSNVRVLKLPNDLTKENLVSANLLDSNGGGGQITGALSRADEGRPLDVGVPAGNANALPATLTVSTTNLLT